MQCYSGLALALATFLSSAILAHTYICVYIFIWAYLSITKLAVLSAEGRVGRPLGRPLALHTVC